MSREKPRTTMNMGESLPCAHWELIKLSIFLYLMYLSIGRPCRIKLATRYFNRLIAARDNTFVIYKAIRLYQS